MAFAGNARTLVRDWEFILESDPALDRSAEDFADKYRTYIDQGDPSILPLKSDEQPTVWKLRHPRGEAADQLTDDLFLHLRQSGEGEAPPTRLCNRACRLSLIGWKHLLDDDGNEVPAPTREPKGPGGAMQLTEDVMHWLQNMPGVPKNHLTYTIGVQVLNKLVSSPLS